MMRRALAAGVVAVLWTVVHLIEWLDPGEYDEEAEEADWPEPPEVDGDE